MSQEKTYLELSEEGGGAHKFYEVIAPVRMDVIALSSAVEVVHDSGGGVVVECFEDRGQMRVRVVSPGYNTDWRVQFPKNIREPRARYVVTEVRQCGRGGFYRAYGDIRRLV